MSLTDLPTEILFLITANLQIAAIRALTRTNRNLHQQLSDVVYEHNIRLSRSSALAHAAEYSNDEKNFTFIRRLIHLGANLNTCRRGTEDTPLYLAAFNGHANVVHILLSAGANPRFRGENGNSWSPLQGAAAGGNEGIVRMLLEWGAEEDTGRTAFSVACEYGREAVVRFFLARDADLDVAEGLSAAISRGREGVIRILLEERKERGKCGPDGEGAGLTPLMRAAARGQERTVRLLLGCGADPNAEDGSQRHTALFHAVLGGHDRVLGMLMARGDVDLNHRDVQGRTILHLAVWRENSGILERLLAVNSVNTGLRNNKGQTALTEALEGGKTRAAEVLVASGQVDVAEEDGQRGFSPLLWAAQKGQTEMIELLLSRGARIDCRDADGRTPLSWAISHGASAGARLLLDLGADPESRDKDGNTPFRYAVQRQDLEMVSELCDRGVDVHSRNSWSHSTPVFGAMLGENAEAMVTFLLDKGVDLNVRDKYGQTPLFKVADSWLRSNQGVTVRVRFLLEKGADPNARCNDGMTPLLVAAMAHNMEGMKQLLDWPETDRNAVDNKGQDVCWWARYRERDEYFKTDRQIREMLELLESYGFESNPKIPPPPLRKYG